jgi:hypothetical protein
MIDGIRCYQFIGLTAQPIDGLKQTLLALRHDLFAPFGRGHVERVSRICLRNVGRYVLAGTACPRSRARCNQWSARSASITCVMGTVPYSRAMPV